MSETQIETPEGEIVAELPLAPERVEAAPPEPPVVTEEAEEEETPAPGKRTVLDDLKEERAERRALSTKVRELEEQASLTPRLQRELERLQAELDTLKPKAPTQPEVPDEEADATAARYGLFTVAGEPDRKAGRNIALDMKQRIASTAQAMVQSEIAPLRRETQESRAQSLTTAAFQKATQDKFCSTETLTKIVQGLTLEQRANADVMNAALVMAAGIDAAQGKLPGKAAPAPVVPAPLVTEASGGRRGLAPGPLSDIEQRAAKSAGMTEAQWKEHTKDYKPGQPVRLE